MSSPLSPRRSSLLVAVTAALLLSSPSTVVGAAAVPPTATATATSVVAAAPLSGAVGVAAKKKRTTKRVITRHVSFRLINRNETSVPCRGDNRTYTVKGRLVGPPKAVDGYAGANRVNLLVHDAGTGGWFWNLRRYARYDYATALAKKGETSLVLDRLGYDRSPLRSGRDTCLGAQASMLSQVVEHLYSGRFEYHGPAQNNPRAATVVVHGHGTGAAIAQLEAAEFKNTSGLVLMSWSGANGASTPALSEARRQLGSCLFRGSAATFGASATDYRDLLFARAPGRVQQRAVQLRNPVPCGDVTSLASAALTADSSLSQVRVPVLVLAGSDDRRLRGNAQDAAAGFTRSPSVTARTIAGAGSALVLEKSAPTTRRIVKRWLDRR